MKKNLALVALTVAASVFAVSAIASSSSCSLADNWKLKTTGVMKDQYLQCEKQHCTVKRTKKTITANVKRYIPVVLVAQKLTPSDTATLDSSHSKSEACAAAYAKGNKK